MEVYIFLFYFFGHKFVNIHIESIYGPAIYNKFFVFKIMKNISNNEHSLLNNWSLYERYIYKSHPLLKRAFRESFNNPSKLKPNLMNSKNCYFQNQFWLSCFYNWERGIYVGIATGDSKLETYTWINLHSIKGIYYYIKTKNIYIII